jgi:hypothetical protein
MALGGFGRLWEALLWEALGGFARLLGRSGRLWEALGGYGRLWEALGGFGKLWEALGGFGKLWEVFFKVLKTIPAAAKHISGAWEFIAWRI